METKVIVSTTLKSISFYYNATFLYDITQPFTLQYKWTHYGTSGPFMKMLVNKGCTESITESRTLIAMSKYFALTLRVPGT